jgi:hypothetical protein
MRVLLLLQQLVFLAPAASFAVAAAASNSDRVPGSRLQAAGSTPVEKRVNWFGNLADNTAGAAQEKFMLGDHRDISDGLYICCGGLSFHPNGTAQLQT